MVLPITKQNHSKEKMLLVKKDLSLCGVERVSLNVKRFLEKHLDFLKLICLQILPIQNAKKLPNVNLRIDFELKVSGDFKHNLARKNDS